MKHLLFNEKKIYALFLWLMLGIGLIFYGVISYAIDMRTFKAPLTDEEIIERAKGLGMVELKVKLNSDEATDD